MLSQVLLNPAVNKSIASLDNGSSMLGIAFRDAADTSGRVYQEFQRNKYGGREYLFEETATNLTWGFGITGMKWLYDRVISRTSPIRFPWLDAELLKAGPQQLTRHIIERHALPAEKAALLTALNQTKRYQRSNIAKFIFATLLPVLFIGFGISRLKQCLTEWQIRHDQKAKAKATILAPPKTGTGFPQTWHRTLPAAATNRNTPWPRQAVPTAYSQAVGYGSVNKAASFPMQQQMRQPVLQNVRFGFSPSKTVQNLLNDERMHNLVFIDLPLGGGRVYNARNPVEKFEEFFRNANITFALFFLADWIKGNVQKLVDRASGHKLQSTMDIRALRTLHQAYQHHPDLYQRHVRELWSALALSGKPSEAQLAQAIREYYLNIGTRQPSVLMQIAEQCGWVPVLKPKPDKPGLLRQLADACRLKPLRPYSPHSGTMLDITRKIHLGKIILLAEQLEKLATVARSENIPLRTLLTRSLRSNFVAFSVATFLCFLYVSYLTPKVQHWITFKLTGKNDFPGVRQYNLT